VQHSVGRSKRTVQISIAHLVAHVPHEQGLGRQVLLLWPVAKGVVAPLLGYVKLHCHPSTLENLLIQLSYGPICGFLCSKLHVPKPFTYPSVISDDARIADLAISRELPLQIGRSDFEEEVAT